MLIILDSKIMKKKIRLRKKSEIVEKKIISTNKFFHFLGKK
jgi:hypothetical protein